MKTGLPQGLHWSPLLAIMIKDYAFKKVGIESISYADDGLMIVEGVYDEWRKSLKEKEKVLKETYGIILSDKVKSNGELACKRAGEVIDFLGVRWRRTTDEVETEAGLIPFEVLTEKQLVEGVPYVGGTEVQIGKEWKVNRKSYIERIGKSLPTQTELGTRYVEGLIKQARNAVTNKGRVDDSLRCRTVCWSSHETKWEKKSNEWSRLEHKERYYDVIGSSSECCNILLGVIWHRKYRANNILTKFPSKSRTRLFDSPGLTPNWLLIQVATKGYTMENEALQRWIGQLRSPNRKARESELNRDIWKRDGKIWLERLRKLGKGTVQL